MLWDCLLPAHNHVSRENGMVLIKRTNKKNLSLDVESGRTEGVYMSSMMSYFRGEQHQGQEVQLSKSQFVFSDDCHSPDTRHEAYMKEHLAIFHSSYIDECVTLKDTAKVVLGDYFLPPFEVMEVLRGHTTVAWEKYSDHSADTIRRGSCLRKSTRLSVPDKHTRLSVPDECQRAKAAVGADGDVVHIDRLPKVSGTLERFHPGENGCMVFLKSS